MVSQSHQLQEKDRNYYFTTQILFKIFLCVWCFACIYVQSMDAQIPQDSEGVLEPLEL